MVQMDFQDCVPTSHWHINLQTLINKASAIFSQNAGYEVPTWKSYLTWRSAWMPGNQKLKIEPSRNVGMEERFARIMNVEDGNWTSVMEQKLQKMHGRESQLELPDVLPQCFSLIDTPTCEN